MGAAAQNAPQQTLASADPVPASDQLPEELLEELPEELPEQPESNVTNPRT